MSNATYEVHWREAMEELGEQLEVEGVNDDEDDKGGGAAQEITIGQAFQHFACLYIKYIQIFRKLESCYDNILHPQKRIHVKKVLELVIRRVVELKADLVRWNPPNSYVKMPDGPEEAFPWEYVHLDEILVDLKLSPSVLEIPVPRYFKEHFQKQLEQRDRLVAGYTRLKHNKDSLQIEDKYESPLALENMTLDDAIMIIQKNERGRQGLERVAIYRANRDKEAKTRMFDASAGDEEELDPEAAATNIQRIAKGFVSRRIATRERQNELMFVGMCPKKDNLVGLSDEVNSAYVKRKQQQVENKEEYERALLDLKDVIVDEEGPDKREQFREDRTLWITDQIAQDKYPEDLEDYYASKLAPEEDQGEAAAGGKDDKGKGKKDDKKGAKEEKGKGKGGKGGKGGKSGGKGDDELAMPKLQGKTDLTEAMAKMVEEFESKWTDEDPDNFQQKHDIEQAKEVVRPDVYEEIRVHVDEMLKMNLKKIQLQLAPKGKKGKKGKKKKKGKKGKKDKKKKPLPGEKIAELKGLDSDQILAILIENQLVVRCRQRPLSTFVGDFNYLGSMLQSADRKDEGKWEPPDPSLSYLRQAVTEYCVLPLGSEDIHKAIDPDKTVKSVMFYGPGGSGKTLAVEAAAHELGALLIHLSPEKLRGQFPGKNGPTKLVHMAFTIARDPTMQPVIIYIDECEQFFTGGKKNKDKDGPSRFKKDLLLYKNQALQPEHRVVVIGSTKAPEVGDLKDMRGFFDKFLFFPYPDYASRRLVLNYYLEQQVLEGLEIIEKRKLTRSGVVEEGAAAKVRAAVASVDVSSLAHISEGYSAGALARTVRAIVTKRRVLMLKNRPLATQDFIDNLSLQEVNYQDDKKAFLEFTRTITGLDDRRKKIEAIVSGEVEDKGKGGDKKKKK